MIFGHFRELPLRIFMGLIIEGGEFDVGLVVIEEFVRRFEGEIGWGF